MARPTHVSDPSGGVNIAAVAAAATLLIPNGPATKHHPKHYPSPRVYAGACLAAIIDREGSGWNPGRWNSGGSGAYGLPQALPGYKMASAGRDWRTNPYTQIRWMRHYTRGRYGGECAALAFHRAHGWY